MPEISRFHGIVIRMFAESGQRHHRGHFHAEYQGAEATIDIDRIELLDGSLPPRQRRLVTKWARLHQGELASNWELLVSGRPPFRIKPLE